MMHTRGRRPSQLSLVTHMASVPWVETFGNGVWINLKLDKIGELSEAGLGPPPDQKRCSLRTVADMGRFFALMKSVFAV